MSSITDMTRWTAVQLSDDRCHVVDILADGPGGTRIANITGAVKHGAVCPATCAGANLIASAPLLLSLLQQARAALPDAWAAVKCGVPRELHIFSFRFPEVNGFRREATVLARGRMGQAAAIGHANDQAGVLGHGSPFCMDIRTVPAPRPTPALDALCARCTASPTFVALLTAPAGYRPSIRLDLLGRDGAVARARLRPDPDGLGRPAPRLRDIGRVERRATAAPLSAGAA